MNRRSKKQGNDTRGTTENFRVRERWSAWIGLWKSNGGAGSEQCSLIAWSRGRRQARRWWRCRQGAVLAASQAGHGSGCAATGRGGTIGVVEKNGGADASRGSAATGRVR